MIGYRHLEVAIKQIETEILDDRATIRTMVEDPSIFKVENPEDVSYMIHDKAHHLAQHLEALRELMIIKEEYDRNGKSTASDIRL